jgi:hypothetical protein
MTSTDTMSKAVATAVTGDDSRVSSAASKKHLKTPAGGSEPRDETALTIYLSRQKMSKGDAASVPASEVASQAPTTRMPNQPRQTKASVVEALLTREGGASLEAMSEATGWQAHTCRAFLTGMRKKGREPIRASDKDGKSIYLIAPDRSPAPPSEAEQDEAESH